MPSVRVSGYFAAHLIFYSINKGKNMFVDSLPSLQGKAEDALRVLDATKISAYMKCWRHFFIEHVLGWRKAESLHLDFGIAYHEGMEEYYLSNGDVNKAVKAFTMSYVKMFGGTDDENVRGSDKKTFNSGCNAIRKYSDEFGMDFAPQMVESVGKVILGEREFAIKVDLFGRFYATPRELHFMDHKTASINSDTFRRSWKISPQMTLYETGRRQIFGEIEGGGVINAAFFRTKDNVDFLRIPVTFGDNELKALQASIIKTADDIERDLTRFFALSEDERTAKVLELFPINGIGCGGGTYSGCYHKSMMTSICQIQNPLLLKSAPIGYLKYYWDPTEGSDDYYNKAELLRSKHVR